MDSNESNTEDKNTEELYITTTYYMAGLDELRARVAEGGGGSVKDWPTECQTKSMTIHVTSV